jgi:hypothetical protein
LKRLLFAVLFAPIALAASDSDDLLRRAAEKLVKRDVAIGHFTQTATVAALTAPLISLGAFYFDRERGVSWHVEQPISAHFVFRPAASELRSAPARQMPMQWIAQLLNAAMAGDLGELSRTFSVGGSVGADGWSLSLKPKSPAVAKVLVEIDVAGNAAVDRIELREANGDTVAIAFSNIEHPDALPAEIQVELDQPR